jgi:predicted amidophosphoribosyltransferase
VPECPSCGTPAPMGALFCARCGRTVPQTGPALPDARPGTFPPNSPSVPGNSVAPSYRSAAPPIPPAPQWIPPSLVGRAVHCPRCNTLISPVAVVCPVCLGPVEHPDAAVGGVAPGR